ncbi:MAG: FAD-dependent oxidoreductase [Candidatus Acetothermia bacterium]|nr:FAD-dependent oxidoreductase [Candidatus Acetothermia bacterium]MDH7505794.1 FAD-dependent oxidoreductase [Candidatus Acetothermia bacterium]
MYDLAIIGGGPAAMTAAIYAARKVLKTLLIAKEQGGQLLLASSIHSWPGAIEIGGFELAESFRKHVEHYGVEQQLGVEVVGIREKKGNFELLTTAGETILAQAVLIATGGRPKPLGVPGEEEFTGRGVSYCATCDGPLYKGKRVAVIGGGNSAFGGAIDLLPIASRIYIVDIAERWFADPILQRQVLGAEKVRAYQEHRVVEIKGDQFVNGLLIERLKSGKREELEVEGVFVEIGNIPNTDFLRGFLKLNERGEIIFDGACRTSVPGVFAAGDVVAGLDKQIVIAAGQGAQAALSAYRYLVESGKLVERGLEESSREEAAAPEKKRLFISREGG